MTGVQTCALPIWQQVSQSLNPLQAADTVASIGMKNAETQNLQTQGQQMNMALEAQRALGQIAQAVPKDPTTGQPDSKAFVGMLLSNPATAVLADKFLPAAAGISKDFSDATAAGLNAADAHFQAVSKVAQPLLYKLQNMPSGSDMGDFRNAVMAAHKQLLSGPNPVLKPGDADPIVDTVLNAPDPASAAFALAPIVARGQTFDNAKNVVNGQAQMTPAQLAQVGAQGVAQTQYTQELEGRVGEAQGAKNLVGAIIPIVEQLKANSAAGSGIASRAMIENAAKAIGTSPAGIMGNKENLTNSDLYGILSSKLKVVAPNLLGQTRNAVQDAQFDAALPTNEKQADAQLQAWKTVDRFANRPMNELSLYSHFLKTTAGKGNFTDWQIEKNNLGIKTRNSKTNTDIFDSDPMQVQSLINSPPKGQ